MKALYEVEIEARATVYVLAESVAEAETIAKEDAQDECDVWSASAVECDVETAAWREPHYIPYGSDDDVTLRDLADEQRAEREAAEVAAEIDRRQLKMFPEEPR